jgi:hypothetical protein
MERLSSISSHGIACIYTTLTASCAPRLAIPISRFPIGTTRTTLVARFDITKNVRELKALKLWNDAETSVTFVMRGLVDREGRPLPVSPGVRARFDNVKVSAITAQ